MNNFKYIPQFYYSGAQNCCGGETKRKTRNVCEGKQRKTKFFFAVINGVA